MAFGLSTGGWGAVGFGGGVMEPRGATSFGGGYQELINQYLAQTDQGGAPMTPDAWAESMADPQRSRNLIQYFGGNYANYLTQWRRRARGVRPSARDRALYNRMTLGSGAAANPASDDAELDRMLGGAGTPVTQGRTYAGRRVGGDTISSTDIRGNVTTRPTGVALGMDGQPAPMEQQSLADQGRLISMDQIPYARRTAELQQQAERGQIEEELERQKMEQEGMKALTPEQRKYGTKGGMKVAEFEEKKREKSVKEKTDAEKLKVQQDRLAFQKDKATKDRELKTTLFDKNWTNKIQDAATKQGFRKDLLVVSGDIRDASTQKRLVASFMLEEEIARTKHDWDMVDEVNERKAKFVDFIKRQFIEEALFTSKDESPADIAAAAQEYANAFMAKATAPVSAGAPAATPAPATAPSSPVIPASSVRQAGGKSWAMHPTARRWAQVVQGSDGNWRFAQ